MEGDSSLCEGLVALHHFEVLLICSEGQQSLSPRETSGVVGSKVENTFNNRNDTVQKQAHRTSEAHSCTSTPHTTQKSKISILPPDHIEGSQPKGGKALRGLI